ncbi:MAG: hypothetical protein FWB99_12065, partial [Treponema sp.]|nr:hypothetical protein [Treponema sp.]
MTKKNDGALKAIFTFNDIAALNDWTVQRFLLETNYFTLIDALATAGAPLRDTVFKNVPEREAARLKTALENPQAASREASEKARAEIINTIRSLHSSGDINIGGDFYFPDIQDISPNQFDYTKGSIPGEPEKAHKKDYIIPPEIIPQGISLSYRDFANSYYRMVETLAYFNDKARREGLLALYEVVDDGLDDVFLKKGLSLILDGTDAETVRYVLTVSMEHEHDFYRKKLMGIAIEGLLAIQCLTPSSLLIFRLNLLVDIKDNPIDAAYERCLSGDREAFLNIDFSSAIVNEHMREEVRFIIRAIELSEISRRQGRAAVESHLDADAVAKRDVFEYGLSLLFYDT